MSIFVYCLFAVLIALVPFVHSSYTLIVCYLVTLAQLIFDIVTFHLAIDHGVFGLDLPV